MPVLLQVEERGRHLLLLWRTGARLRSTAAQRLLEEGVEKAQGKASDQPQVPARGRGRAEGVHVQAPADDLQRRCRRGARRSARPERAQESLFAIFLHPRPGGGATQIETAFWALGAEVVPFSALRPEQVAGMQGQLRAAHELKVANGALGAMQVVLVCIDVVNGVMMGFSDPPSPIEYPGKRWKHWLLSMLNGGL
ncbi:hypothetical protein BD413DRAFT_655675, partial [Trametes elegans]